MAEKRIEKGLLNIDLYFESSFQSPVDPANLRRLSYVNEVKNNETSKHAACVEERKTYRKPWRE